jgi:hypothetical protein
LTKSEPFLKKLKTLLCRRSPVSKKVFSAFILRAPNFFFQKEKKTFLLASAPDRAGGEALTLGRGAIRRGFSWQNF